MAFRKSAFTLAETLIALVIIGIVAALTLPVIMENYTRKTVETRLQKFYTTMNSAIRRAEVDFGDKRDWDALKSPLSNEEWFNKYLAPYLSIMKTEYDGSSYIIYLNDGSSFFQGSNKVDWQYFPGSYSRCNKSYRKNGSCSFSFKFQPNAGGENAKYYYNKGFEPYKADWDGTKEGLYTTGTYNCKTSGGYCCAIIQENGWKFPDDYPRKVRL